MKLLEQEGLVETRRGIGRFATALSGLRPERPMTKFESITKMMTELGYEVSTKVVGVAQRAATPSEQLAFDLKPRSQVVETRRLREHKGRPCVYSVNVLDPRTLETPVEDIDWSGSVVVILEGMGHEIVASSAHISVVTEPLEEDALVEFGPLPGPWLDGQRAVRYTARALRADLPGLPPRHHVQFQRGSPSRRRPWPIRAGLSRDERVRAGVFQGPGTIQILEVDDPHCGEGEVVIAVAQCGVCGTDRSIFRGEYSVSLP